MIESFDDCLLELGNPGRFRICLYILLLLNMFYAALNFTIAIYLGFVPKHHCRLPPDSSWSLNESIPLIESSGHLELDQCHLWINPANTSLGTTGCMHGWDYELEDKEWFVSTQYDLVCDRLYILNMAISVEYAGNMLGGILFGLLSDNFGRRKSLIIAMFGHSVFSISLAFATSASIYTLFAFCLGLFMQGLHSCSYTISSELFHARHRTIQGVFNGFPWSLSVITIAAVFWKLQNWSHVQLFSGLVSLLGVFYVWFIPESLKWHMARGNVDEMWKISQRFARFNKTPLRASLKDEFTQLVTNTRDNQTKSGIEYLKEILGSQILRKYSLIMGFTFFSACTMYLGIALAIPKLGGNKYVSYIISGSVEMASRFIPIFIYQRFGRRRPFSLFLATCSILCLLSAVLRFYTNIDGILNYAPIVLAIIANLTLMMAYAGLALYVTEIFPTLLRSAGLGFCITFGRIGPMFSPQIMLLELVWKLLPFILFCGLGLVCSCLTLLLPETNKKPLPDTLADVGKMNQRSVK